MFRKEGALDECFCVYGPSTTKAQLQGHRSLYLSAQRALEITSRSIEVLIEYWITYRVVYTRPARYFNGCLCWDLLILSSGRRMKSGIQPSDEIVLLRPAGKTTYPDAVALPIKLRDISGVKSIP
jgi:hypothetical protein